MTDQKLIEELRFIAERDSLNPEDADDEVEMIAANRITELLQLNKELTAKYNELYSKYTVIMRWDI